MTTYEWITSNRNTNQLRKQQKAAPSTHKARFTKLCNCRNLHISKSKVTEIQSSVSIHENGSPGIDGKSARYSQNTFDVLGTEVLPSTEGDFTNHPSYVASPTSVNTTHRQYPAATGPSTIPDIPMKDNHKPENLINVTPPRAAVSERYIFESPLSATLQQSFHTPEHAKPFTILINTPRALTRSGKRLDFTSEHVSPRNHQQSIDTENQKRDAMNISLQLAEHMQQLDDSSYDDDDINDDNAFGEDDTSN